MVSSHFRIWTHASFRSGLLLPLRRKHSGEKVVRGPGGAAHRSGWRPVVAAAAVAYPLLAGGTGWAGPTSLAAQASGEIRGVVVSLQEGRPPVADVRVELRLSDGEERGALTGDDGTFRLEDVPAGTHRLRLRHPTYHLLEREVAVEPGEVVQLHLELAPTVARLTLDTLRGFVAPLRIRREDTEIASRIDRREMELLPTAYEIRNLVRLTPGASPGRIWGGAADEANLYQLDGLPQTHPGTGGPLLSLSPSWLSAVEVRGLGAGAEHGDFQGGIVNAVTRSGTNFREGDLRISVETHPLNATNLVQGEVGRERAFRVDVDGTFAGPLVRNRLFYFAGAEVLREAWRAQSRLEQLEGRFLPYRDERRELRGMAKLSWTPTATDRIDLAGGASSSKADHYGLSGWETLAALPARHLPSRFVHADWRRETDDDGYLAVQALAASARETWEPTRGPDVPAVRAFTPGDPPTPIFQNAPFLVDRKPVTRTLSAQVGREVSTGPFQHRLLIGAELGRSSWMDRRIRTGGLTWRPPDLKRMDPSDPSTWSVGGVIPSDWGGEIDLHAEMGSEAIYIQDNIDLHSRLTVSPGLRFTRWWGDLLPGGDDSRRVEAVRTRALAPRIGLIFDLLGSNELVFKVHWGRYHQGLLSPFFDRAQGGEVFGNRELWYYRGGAFNDPTLAFTGEERDAMSVGDDPSFELQELIRLNETAPVAEDLRQPRVDQWMLSLEKTFGPRVRLEVLALDRKNRDMIAVRDRRLEANHHCYQDVRVLRSRGFLGEEADTIYLGDEPLTLPRLCVSNDWIRQLLVWQAAGEGIEVIPPPGFVPADTAGLLFEQDLILENVSAARRHLEQLQISAHVAWPSWRATGSVVFSRLRGNLDSVTGYEADTHVERFWEVGAGPFVRPNEQVNFHGDLPGVPPIEVKIAVHGELPWSLSGGAFFHGARGERFTPYFTISAVGFQYHVPDGDGGLQQLDPRILRGVLGQRVFLRERGRARYDDRASLDLRLERDFSAVGGTWRITWDLFNVFNTGAVTRVNRSATHAGTGGRGFTAVDPSAVYLSVWERAPPRTVRLGFSATF